MTGHVHYRVGRHQAQNVYRHDPGGDPDGLYIGVFFNPETAALIVEALNGRDEAVRQRDFAQELLAAYEQAPASVQLNEQIVANQELARRANELEDLLRAAIPVLAYVSRGRGYIEPYPDIVARRVLGQIDEAIRLEPK